MISVNESMERSPGDCKPRDHQRRSRPSRFQLRFPRDPL